jgi:hypothetical protein
MRGVLLVLGLGACAGGGGGATITDQALTGVIGGEAFTLEVAWADAFMSDDESAFTTLAGEPVTECGYDALGSFMLLSLPLEVGVYPMSLSQNATFVVGAGENLIATQGVIEIEAVDDTTIDFGINATFDGDNEVDGRGTVTRCAEEM